MDRRGTLRLIERLIERVETNSGDDAPEPLEEDVEDFLAPDRLWREREQFFVRAPQVIGFAGQVREPGRYLTKDVAGVPVLVTRDHDGELRAFVNACAHRGAQVAADEGHAARLTCRFHGWTYALDGSLAGRRRDDAFAPAHDGCRLRSLPVSDRSGLIVVGPHPEIPQDRVDGHLASIEAELCGFGFEDMETLAIRRFTVEANWKVVSGLSCESYHFATLHRDSVARWLRANYVMDEFGDHCRWAFPLVGIERLRDQPPETWPESVPGAVSHVLFPGTVVITNGRSAQLIRSEPGPAAGTTVVEYAGVCHRDEDREAALGAYHFGGDAFEHEDLVAAVEASRGLAAGRDRIEIGRNEPVLQFFHRRWRERLR